MGYLGEAREGDGLGVDVAGGGVLAGDAGATLESALGLHDTTQLVANRKVTHTSQKHCG